MHQYLLQRLSWPCLWAGLAFVFWSGPALAQSAANNQPLSTRDLFTTLIGVVIALIGAFVAGMKRNYDRQLADMDRSYDKRVSRVESENKSTHDELVEIHKLLLSNYHPKPDVQAMFNDLKAAVLRVHQRLDRLGVPTLYGHGDGNGGSDA